MCGVWDGVQPKATPAVNTRNYDVATGCPHRRDEADPDRSRGEMRAPPSSGRTGCADHVPPSYAIGYADPSIPPGGIASRAMKLVVLFLAHYDA